MVVGVKRTPCQVFDARSNTAERSERQLRSPGRRPMTGLHSPPRLAQGAFDEIGVPDPLRVLTWESQVCRQGLDVAEQALDRGGIERLVVLGEGVDATGHLADRILAQPGFHVVKCAQLAIC